MDHVRKAKRFIAFINKDGRDRHWINGNFPWAEDGPTLFPYDTREQKKIADEVAEKLVCWSETGDIEGIILQPVDDVFPIHIKKESGHLVDKYEKIFEEQKQRQLEENQRRKKRNENISEVDGESHGSSDETGGEKNIHSDSDSNETNVSVPSPNNEPKENVINNDSKNVSQSKRVVSDKKLSIGKKTNASNDTSKPAKIDKVEPKRSPLELKPKTEKPKKEELAPSKPVKQSKLNKLIKEKKP